MEIMIWAGAAVSLVGVAGLFYCIIRAARMKRSTASEEVQRQELRRIVLINMAALGVSAIGLMLVILGIILG